MLNRFIRTFPPLGVIIRAVVGLGVAPLFGIRRQVPTTTDFNRLISSRARPAPLTPPQKGLFGNRNLQTGRFLQNIGHPSEERATSGERDPRIHDIGGKFRSRTFEHGLHGFNDGSNGLRQARRNLPLADRQGARHAAHQNRGLAPHENALRLGSALSPRRFHA